MATQRMFFIHSVLLILSCGAGATAYGWSYDYGDDQPYGAMQQRDEPTVHFGISTDDPTPRVSIQNNKAFDSTGNLIIDNDMQQESENCKRIRSRMKGKDAAKLNC